MVSVAPLTSQAGLAFYVQGVVTSFESRSFRVLKRVRLIVNGGRSLFICIVIGPTPSELEVKQQTLTDSQLG